MKQHLVPMPCNWQEHLPLEKVAQCPIQPDIELFYLGLLILPPAWKMKINKYV